MLEIDTKDRKFVQSIGFMGCLLKFVRYKVYLGCPSVKNLQMPSKDLILRLFFHFLWFLQLLLFGFFNKDSKAYDLVISELPSHLE